MKIEPLLQINIAMLVVLGTLLLGMGQQNLLLPLAAVIVAGLAVWLTDFRRVFQLGPVAAAYAAMATLGLLVWQIFRNADQSQLLNVANLLICLQAILLFQPKSERAYWSLLALSLLQVVVAAALNPGLLFGVLLVVYLLAALAAMALFYVLRETQPLLELAGRGEHRATAERPAVGASGQPSVSGNFLPHLSPDLARGVFSRTYFGRLGWLIFVTVLATVLIFFAVPRFSNSVWQGAQQQQVSTVGFTEEVNLDDLGRILESPEEVMRVEFVDPLGAPYAVYDEPYFRGTVLTQYRGQGHWRQQRSGRPPESIRRIRPPDLAGLIRQRITLQRGSHSVLFNVSPCYPTDQTSNELRMDLSNRQVELDDKAIERRGSYRYELGTTAFQRGQQTDLLPALRGLNAQVPIPWMVELPERVQPIQAVADRILERQGLQEASAYEKAKALESHFMRANGYRYSLDLQQIRRQRDLDPILDFVQNHRTGHCEYYASALTLMLVSQGIPARLVVGYKGGDYNTVGAYFTVRQLHAHAWVEAYLGADQLPAELREGAQDMWLRLDPTPSGGEPGLRGGQFAMLVTVREFIDYCQVLWDEYVLGLNSSRQQASIYRPLIRNLQTFVYSLFSRDAWQNRWQTLQGYLHAFLRGRWLTWQFGISMIAIGGLLYVVRERLHQLARWLGRLSLLPRRHFAAGKRPFELYWQLEQLLARHGFQRAPQQTQHEFALAVGGQLAELSRSVHVAGVPRRIADAFYRIRFGQQSLTDWESEQLRGELHRLQEALEKA